MLQGGLSQRARSHRVIFSFGNWYGIILIDQPDAKNLSNGKPVVKKTTEDGLLIFVQMIISMGQPWAQTCFFYALCSFLPCYRQVFIFFSIYEHDQFILNGCHEFHWVMNFRVWAVRPNFSFTTIGPPSTVKPQFTMPLGVGIKSCKSKGTVIWLTTYINSPIKLVG